MIYINNVALPNPQVDGYNVTVIDIDSEDTNRNERGVMIRNRIRQGVYKVQAKWILRGAQLSSLLTLTQPAQFPVRFLDPLTNSYRSATMYVGDRSLNVKAYTSNMSADQILWDVSFSLIEY